MQGLGRKLSLKLSPKPLTSEVVRLEKPAKKGTIDTLVGKLAENLDKILATTVILMTGIPMPLKLLGAGYLTKKYYDHKYKNYERYKAQAEAYEKLMKYQRVLERRHKDVGFGPYEAQMAYV